MLELVDWLIAQCGSFTCVVLIVALMFVGK